MMLNQNYAKEILWDGRIDQLGLLLMENRAYGCKHMKAYACMYVAYVTERWYVSVAIDRGIK